MTRGLIVEGRYQQPGKMQLRAEQDQRSGDTQTAAATADPPDQQHPERQHRARPQAP